MIVQAVGDRVSVVHPRFQQRPWDEVLLVGQTAAVLVYQVVADRQFEMCGQVRGGSYRNDGAAIF